MRSICNVSDDSATLRHDLFASGTRVPDVKRAPQLGPVVHGASSASTSAFPLATAARNLRLSFSPTDKSAAPSPQDSFRLTSLWTHWVEARPHQRCASGMPVPRGIGSRCTEARVEWQPRQVRERWDPCTDTRKRPILGKASGGAAIQNSSRGCDCGGWRVTRLGGQDCREASDEVLLYQVRRNGEAATRMTKIKVCVSCRAMSARSTAMKCLTGGTAHGPAAERGVAYHQKCQNRPTPRKQYPPLRRGLRVFTDARRLRRKVGKKRAGTFLSRTSSLLRLVLRVSVKSGNTEKLFRALETLTVRLGKRRRSCVLQVFGERTIDVVEEVNVDISEAAVTPEPRQGQAGADGSGSSKLQPMQMGELLRKSLNVSWPCQTRTSLRS